MPDCLGCVNPSCLTHGHHFSHGVYARELRLPAGSVVGSHKHKYEHMSVLASGIVEVTVGGEMTLYIAPTVVIVAAELEHQIRAIADSVWFCIHAADERDIDALEKEMIQWP